MVEVEEEQDLQKIKLNQTTDKSESATANRPTKYNQFNGSEITVKKVKKPNNEKVQKRAFPSAYNFALYNRNQLSNQDDQKSTSINSNSNRSVPVSKTKSKNQKKLKRYRQNLQKIAKSLNQSQIEVKNERRIKIKKIRNFVSDIKQMKKIAQQNITIEKIQNNNLIGTKRKRLVKFSMFRRKRVNTPKLKTFILNSSFKEEQTSQQNNFDELNNQSVDTNLTFQKRLSKEKIQPQILDILKSKEAVKQDQDNQSPKLLDFKRNQSALNLKSTKSVLKSKKIEINQSSESDLLKAFEKPPNLSKMKSIFPKEEESKLQINKPKKEGGLFDKKEVGGGLFDNKEADGGLFDKKEVGGGLFDNKKEVGGGLFDKKEVGGGLFDKKEEGGGLFDKKEVGGGLFDKKEGGGGLFDNKEDKKEESNPQIESKGLFNNSEPKKTPKEINKLDLLKGSNKNDLKLDVKESQNQNINKLIQKGLFDNLSPDKNKPLTDNNDKKGLFGGLFSDKKDDKDKNPTEINKIDEIFKKPSNKPNQLDFNMNSLQRQESKLPPTSLQSQNKNQNQSSSIFKTDIQQNNQQQNQQNNNNQQNNPFLSSTNKTSSQSTKLDELLFGSSNQKSNDKSNPFKSNNTNQNTNIINTQQNDNPLFGNIFNTNNQQNNQNNNNQNNQKSGIFNGLFENNNTQNQNYNKNELINSIFDNKNNNNSNNGQGIFGLNNGGGGVGGLFG